MQANALDRDAKIAAGIFAEKFKALPFSFSEQLNIIAANEQSDAIYQTILNGRVYSVFVCVCESAEQHPLNMSSLFPGFSYEKDAQLYFDDTCVVPERMEGKGTLCSGEL